MALDDQVRKNFRGIAHDLAAWSRGVNDGSFDLEPIDGGKRTRVMLTTRYMPLLNPRFTYQWAEALAIHTLHGHVLAGMKDTAEGRTQ